MLETLPEAIAASIRSYIVRRQADPPAIWPLSMLKLLDREDLGLLQDDREEALSDENSPVSVRIASTSAEAAS